MIPRRLWSLIAGFGLFCNSAHAADPLIREEKTIIVDGVAELWQLRWDGPPQPFCSINDVDIAVTCPCSGFAYGEQGKLALVRSRPGLHEEFALGAFFFDPNVNGHDAGASILQRWQPAERAGDNDWKHANDKDFAAHVHKRKPRDLIRLGDYDHDGQPTEFLLQVATKPCGKHQMILVGISKSNPHLHVFSTAEKPQKPLVLGDWEWNALLKSDGHTTVIDWNCGDHGSDYEWKATLDAHDGVLHASFQQFECEQGRSTEKLIREEDR